MVQSVQPIPAEPSQASYQRLQENLGLVSTEPELLEAFAAAPWLLPPNCSGLPYIGVHNFDALLELRAGPAGGYDKAIAILPFSANAAEQAQNAIYTLVKFAGVRNYMMWTWTPEDLAACDALNLPCADGMPHLLHPPGWGDTILLAMWLKPVLTLRAVKRGVAVMISDTDVAYTRKPIIDVLLRMANGSHADAAFQGERPVNTGLFAVPPTPRGEAFAQFWVNTKDRRLNETVRSTDQVAISFDGDAGLGGFGWCDSANSCYNERKKNSSIPLIRTFPSWNAAYDYDNCRLGFDESPMIVDVCSPTVMFIHPICTKTKKLVLSRQRMWFLDEGCVPANITAGTLARCKPLQWRQPHVEARVYDCAPRTLEQLMPSYVGLPELVQYRAGNLTVALAEAAAAKPQR
ncbi:hypothetical protein C2E20_5498 [Micractinium conductrix]|uniref:Nucleotide-diphospho-sugar transferase domain-containing protein n=1 Tax=Micractinium conductrix TaxID=554055 RepID=A0A2P6VAI0_9CHLO|nr:hypothetical protein C2E20_5498 [Micractinium conductrix]|eukprot:PSC71106.1 hypothetical protein C2E20_5498 [Micractinium conductrix]